MECQWVEYLRALTTLNGDELRFILFFVCVHAYMDMFTYIIYMYYIVTSFLIGWELIQNDPCISHYSRSGDQ